MLEGPFAQTILPGRFVMQRCLMLLLTCAVLNGCDYESVDRSDRPLSLAEAQKHIFFPLPASAREIYFCSHIDGMQVRDFYVRFTVDATAMDATVDTLLTGHRTTNTTYDPDALESQRNKLLPMPWWTP